MNTTPLEHTLYPGGYLQFEAQTYRIEAYDANTLVLHTQHLVTGEIRPFHLQELLDEEVRFAPTLEALLRTVEPPALPLPVEHELPEALLAQADHIIQVVETVERMVEAEAQRAQGYAEPFRRTRALQRALAQLDPPLALSTFYKYRQHYQNSAGVRTRLAANLHRSTYNQIRAAAAQLHFVDTLILRYYARQRPLRPMTLFRLGQAVLERTGNCWVDPQQTVPEDLVEELLDPRLPLQTLLDNPDKAAVLTTVKMPSRGWFYSYLRWFEAVFDKQIVIQMIDRKRASRLMDKNWNDRRKLIHLKRASRSDHFPRQSSTIRRSLVRSSPPEHGHESDRTGRGIRRCEPDR